MTTPGGRAPRDVALHLMDALPAGQAAPRPRRSRFGQDPAAQAALASFGALYGRLRAAPAFFNSLDQELTRFSARPTSLIHAARYSAHLGGARIYLKLEDRSPADAHLRIVTDGHAFIARALHRTQVVAAIRSPRVGERLASACARFGLSLQLFAEPAFLQRHATEVARATQFGARVTPVTGDVRAAALQTWLRAPDTVFLSPGLEAGPEPYPLMLRDLTGVIGRECRRQVETLAGRQADLAVVRGGDNAEALSLFPPLIADATRLVCVEAAAEPQVDDPFRPTATRSQQLRIDATLEGSDYVTLGRELADLKAGTRVELAHATAEAARQALAELARLEGILVGPTTAHALAWAAAAARRLPADAVVVVLVAERPAQEMKAS